MLHDARGLAASPPVLYKLMVGGAIASFLFFAAPVCLRAESAVLTQAV
jgi:hypothetical protein